MVVSRCWLLLLPEIVVYQFYEFIHRRARINALGADGQFRSRKGHEGKKLHDAFSINVDGFARLVGMSMDVNVAAKSIGDVRELYRRPGVQAVLVLNDNISNNFTRQRVTRHVARHIYWC